MEHGNAELALLPHELGIVESREPLGMLVEPALCVGDEDVNRSIASGHPKQPNRPLGTFFRRTVVLRFVKIN